MLSKAQLYDIIPVSNSYAVWKSPGLAFLMWQSRSTTYQLKGTVLTLSKWPWLRECIPITKSLHHAAVWTSVSPTVGEHLSFNSRRYHSELLLWWHEAQMGQSPEPERSSHFRITSEHPGPQETSILWRKGRAWTISFLLSAKPPQASTASLSSSSMLYLALSRTCPEFPTLLGHASLPDLHGQAASSHH